MKKTLFFALVMIFSSLSLTTQAQERRLVKAHMMLYSKTQYDIYMEYFNNDHEKSITEMMNRVILNDMRLKRALQNTDPTFSSLSQWMYFGPNQLNVTEDNPDATSLIYAACTQVNQPVYQALQNLKTLYNISNINPYIFTEKINFSKRGENIMIRTASTKFDEGYAGGFLGMVMPPEGDHTLRPITNWPGGPKGTIYSTLGAAGGSNKLNVFAKKGDWYYVYLNNKNQLDSFLLPIGDDTHDFLNPTLGCQWNQVFNQAADLNLPFQTRPDTLTIKSGITRFIEIYPGWNDDNTNEVLYVAGDYILFRRDMHPNEYHATYKQYSATQDDFVAYGVKISDYKEEDVFAADYIVVKTLPDLEYPTIDSTKIPNKIAQGDTITIQLKGDTQLMTSWEPQYIINGVDYQIINLTQESITFIVLSSGNLDFTLHHNSLLVLPDGKLKYNVTSIQQEATTDWIYPNPAGEYVEILPLLFPFREGDLGGGSEIKIYNDMGELVLSDVLHLQDVGHLERIDISQLPSGVYFIKIGDKFAKFVKE